MTYECARFWFHSIDYRRGFVEVAPGIHDGMVNLETFEISPQAQVGGVEWVDDDALADGDVVSNTELELTPDEAENLGRALIKAADRIRSGDIP